MTIEEFNQLEVEIQNVLNNYKEQCDRQGLNFRDRIEDMIESSESEY